MVLADGVFCNINGNLGLHFGFAEYVLHMIE